MTVSSSPINLEVTQFAKERIHAKMLDCGLASPIPWLMWSKWSDQADYCWQVGFYERSQILEGFILEASKTELYFFQEWLLEDLGPRQEINIPRLRRILARIQGAARGA